MGIGVDTGVVLQSGLQVQDWLRGKTCCVRGRCRSVQLDGELDEARQGRKKKKAKE